MEVLYNDVCIKENNNDFSYCIISVHINGQLLVKI